MQTVKDAYKAFRTRGFNAVNAMKRARQSVAADKWESPIPDSRIGPAFDSSGTALHWAECPDRAGLRLVGRADEVCNRIGSRAVDHNGWYADAYQDETISGLVFQLSAANGCARYVAAIDNKCNGDGAAVCLSRVFVGERGGIDGCAEHDYQALRDCAQFADSIAESYAEDEREYSDAWQAGRIWQETGDELADIRKKARQAVREIKAGVTLAPTLCGMLRDKLTETLESMNELRAKRAALADGEGDPESRDSFGSFYTGDKNLRAAFNEGACATVLA